MRNRHFSIWIVGICIIVFVIQMVASGFTDAFLLDQSKPFEIWRFISSIFLHGSFAHILSNMFALALFGIILEGIIGSRNFLIVYFTTGIFANLIAINFYPSSLGASGAIYGVLGALIMLRPKMTVWAFGMPMPMFIAGILWVGAGVLGVFMPSNVGDIAHLSGIGLGLILGIIYRSRYKESKFRENRVYLDEGNVRNWENHHLR